MDKFTGDTQNILDSSSLDVLQTCDYKYKLHRLDGWRKPFKPGDSIHVNWGTAWHDCMDKYDQAIFNGQSIEDATDCALDAAFQHKEAIFIDSDSAKPNNAKNLETLLRSVVWYGEQYKNDPMVVLPQPDGRPAIEVRFEVPIAGTNRRMSGWLDRLVSYDGLIYVMDRKTTGKELNKWFFEAFATANQTFTYLWACRRILGIPVAGFLIDGVQTLVGGSRFNRGIVDVTDSQIDGWLKGLGYDIERADRNAKTGFWPQKFASCEIYNGCQFKGICAKSPEHHAIFLQSDFVKAPPRVVIT